MDRCKHYSSALLLFLLLLAASDLAKAEDKVSPPPVPAPPSKNESLGAGQNSSVASPPRNPVGMPPPMQVSGNSPVPPPIPSSKGTLQPPPPPQKNSSPPKQSPVQSGPGSRSEPPMNAKISGDKGKKDGGNASSLDGRKCGAARTKCWDRLFTCIRDLSDDAKKVLILQNKGNSTITVTAIIQPSGRIIITNMTVVKNSTEKREISVPADANNLKIVLNAGGTNCTVKGAANPVHNFLQHFPKYATRVTPIYGVYAIFLTALLVGGTWACCKFTGLGRRVDAGIPYQQLEMGVQTQSTSVVEADATRGWDQWDSDWDDEEAGSRASQKQHSGDVPANGVATTTSSKDGWENWND